eukprot:169317-Rhodomonas_salina.1
MAVVHGRHAGFLSQLRRLLLAALALQPHALDADEGCALPVLAPHPHARPRQLHDLCHSLRRPLRLRHALRLACCALSLPITPIRALPGKLRRFRHLGQRLSLQRAGEHRD